MNRNPVPLCFVAAVVSILLPPACAGPGAVPGNETLPRPENPALGVAIGAVPPEFEVAVNEGDQLRLERNEGGGEIWLEVTKPEIGGVNLVQLVREWKVKYEERPQGKFYGQVELGTQFGAAYSVRGEFEQDGEMLEERRIFSVHPGGDKVLTMIYLYPAGTNSRERTEEMLNLFSEVESLDFQPAGA